jgi:hypothetical protein
MAILESSRRFSQMSGQTLAYALSIVIRVKQLQKKREKEGGLALLRLLKPK